MIIYIGRSTLREMFELNSHNNCTNFQFTRQKKRLISGFPFNEFITFVDFTPNHLTFFLYFESIGVFINFRMLLSRASSRTLIIYYCKSNANKTNHEIRQLNVILWIEANSNLRNLRFVWTLPVIVMQWVLTIMFWFRWIARFIW